MDSQTFSQRYGTEQQCRDYLFHLRWEHGYRCPRCECDEKWEVNDYKYKCRNCDYQTTVTAGTLLHNTHLPMTAWLSAAQYMTSHEEKVTATGLQKKLNLGSYATASSILRKLRRAVIPSALLKLRGVIEISKITIKDHNSRKTIAIAVEINNKEIGRILANEVKDGSAGIKEFIKSTAEPGSELVCEGFYDYEWMDENGYTSKVRYAEYKFNNTASIGKKIIAELRKSSRINSLDKLLKNICIEFNIRKTKISFDELLRNAMRMPPLQRSKRT